MDPSTRRAAAARETRRRVVEAARDSFLELGYPATTMERIAAAAGVAVQTLYYTFRTRRPNCSARSWRPPRPANPTRRRWPSGPG